MRPRKKTHNKKGGGGRREKKEKKRKDSPKQARGGTGSVPGGGKNGNLKISHKISTKGEERKEGWKKRKEGEKRDDGKNSECTPSKTRGTRPLRKKTNRQSQDDQLYSRHASRLPRNTSELLGEGNLPWGGKI